MKRLSEEDKNDEYFIFRWYFFSAVQIEDYIFIYDVLYNTNTAVMTKI